MLSRQTILFSAVFLLMTLFTVNNYPQGIWYSQNTGLNNYLFDVHFTDHSNGWIAGNTGLVLHTSNGGSTWTEQTTPPNNTYYCIFFTDDQNGWAGGFGGKLIRTTDGGNTWLDGSAGTNRFRYDLYFLNSSKGWVVGGDHGSYPSFTPHREIYFTNNGGISWSAQYSQSGETPLSSIYFIDDNNGFAVGESGSIMRTTNGGNNWYEQTTLTVYDLRDVYFINLNTGWIVGHYLGLPHVPAIFKTTNGGQTWNVQTFGVDEFLSSISFADEFNGWAVGGDNFQSIILHTSDGGENWTYQNSPTNNYLSKVFFENNRGWAVGTNGTVITTGNTVPVELISFSASVSGNNVNLVWKTATEINNSGFEIYRSISAGVFDNISFVQGQGTTTEETVYSYNDNNLNSGIYSYRLAQIDFDGIKHESRIISVDVVTQPVNFILEQNYPNPFNPSTTINYSIPSAGNVKIAVFNSLGQEVATIVDKYEEAGNYLISFNGTALSSGIYYYKLIAGNFVQTKKMILLK